MPICQDCGANFPLLKTDVCNKCRMLEGQSPVEKAVIKASCQLLFCPLSSRYLIFDRLRDNVRLVRSCIPILRKFFVMLVAIIMVHDNFF
jgi:hypothetical protein